MKLLNAKLAAAFLSAGLLMIIVALILQRFEMHAQAISFLIGAGAAWIGLGILGMVIHKIKPAHAKQQEIAKKDERNMQIREKSGYISYWINMFALFILEVVFLLTNNEFACILTISVMFIQAVSFFAALHYYQNKL